MARVSAGASRLQKAIIKWRADPTLFVSSLMGVEPDAQQAEIMRAVAGGDRGIAVKSGHGVGKTTLLGWLSVWWICVHQKAKVRITAPTASQLDDTLLPEMKSWIRKMPAAIQDELFHIKAEKIEFKPWPHDNFISAVTSRADTPDAMQGVHSDHVLLIADEASGVPDPVFESSVGSMRAPRACMVVAGNPVRNKGFFYDCFTKPGLAERWSKFTISCIGHPRIPDEWIEEQKARYGEDSNAFRIRVLGEFPRGDDDACIPMELVQASVTRDITPEGPVRWGVDVARFGMDKSTLCKRQGDVVLERVKAWGGLDTMQVAAAIDAEWEMTPPHMKPAEILIDVIGYGAGVVDRLRQLGRPARGINVSEAAPLNDKYANLRSQLWHYDMRGWFERRSCSIPRDEDLIADLAMPSYRFTPSGKIFVQGKATRLEDYKGMSRSPNYAEALLMTFASRGVALVHGTAVSRDQPLKRPIRGIV